MAASKATSSDRRRGRRWTFADCVLNEDSWSLVVAGERITLESKPMELLHELLLRAGTVVTKDELLDRIWPGVVVVEASLPTAVRKLRMALGDDRRERALIETVAGIGYRLAAPVSVEVPVANEPALVAELATAPADERGVSAASPAAGTALASRRYWLFGGLAAAMLAIAAVPTLILGRSDPVVATAPSFDQRMAANALRRLDLDRIEEMIAAGWNPNTPFDGEGTTAIMYVLNICEWDRGHDQRRLMLIVRTLYDAGGHVDRPNFWGDTAYSIAKAPRYCGPNHPATELIRSMCYSGAGNVGDRCLATYELARRNNGRRTRNPNVVEADLVENYGQPAR